MTLDDFTELSLAQNDPALFFKNHPLPVIIDEVQRAPDLFLQIKLLADNSKFSKPVLNRLFRCTSVGLGNLSLNGKAFFYCSSLAG